MSESRDKLWNAIAQVESGGNENIKDGDHGSAIGPLQIHKIYYQDAVEHMHKHPSDYPLKPSKYEDCKGPGSFEISKAVGNAYMDRYATEDKLGHPPTYEDMARIHNGGPKGYRNDNDPNKVKNTLTYWGKVKEQLK